MLLTTGAVFVNDKGNSEKVWETADCGVNMESQQHVSKLAAKLMQKIQLAPGGTRKGQLLRPRNGARTEEYRK